MVAERFFCMGFLIALAIVLFIWFLVSLARDFKDEFDQKIKCLWDCVHRTGSTDAMLAGRLCRLEDRIKAIEEASK